LPGFFHATSERHVQPVADGQKKVAPKSFPEHAAHLAGAEGERERERARGQNSFAAGNQTEGQPMKISGEVVKQETTGNGVTITISNLVSARGYRGREFSFDMSTFHARSFPIGRKVEMFVKPKGGAS
jgi:hypothetical protein